MKQTSAAAHEVSRDLGLQHAAAIGELAAGPPHVTVR